MFKNKSGALLGVLMGLLIALSLIRFDRETIRYIHRGELPKIENEERLKNLIKNYNSYYSYRNFDGGIINGMKSNQAEKVPAASDYSKTNIQVEGVDEADIVKTDGKYIYYLGYEGINIVQAYPKEEAAVLSKIKLYESGKQNQFNPTELYIYGDNLAVIGSYYGDTKMYYGYKCIVYDIKDRKSPKIKKEFVGEGNYLSSRMINNNIYIVSNKYIDQNRITNGEKNDYLPGYIESGVEKKIELKDIEYFPNAISPSYLIIASIKIDREDKANVSSYLGGGNTIYMSEKNLYVVSSKFTGGASILRKAESIGIIPNSDSETVIYRFNLKDGKVVQNGTGEVKGNVLNQFSMDEYKGNFRIATTRNYSVGNKFIEDNNLYILGSDLNIRGKIENIAQGERIYSVRFLGERAYMVTFKTVDPLFVIDLKNPDSPKILGKLKIPGYSSYLHPYDENHIIGFGKDTIEMGKGQSSPNMAYYQGLKMALFDVSDVNNPKEEFKVIIGDRGTDSELLNNHKALLFSKEKNIIAFPVTLREVKVKNESDFPEYGMFVYQGAYVYSLDLKEGFKLKGKITHMNNEEMIKSGMFDAPFERSVERIIYIENNIYTLSKKILKINDISTMEEIKSMDM